MKRMKKILKLSVTLVFFMLGALGIDFTLHEVPAFAAEEPLTIQKLLFADEVTGLGQYTPRAGARFTMEEPCTVYLEMSGFAMPQTPDRQDEYSVNLAADVAVKLPQSRRLLVFEPDMATMATTARSKLSSYFMGFAFNFDGWTPGNYVLEVGLRDNIGGRTVSQDIMLELAEQ